jgi:hypothetical protein
LDSIRFRTDAWTAQGEHAGQRVWFTADGDGVGLNLFPVAPDLPTGLNSLEQLQKFYLSQMSNSAARLVELRVEPLDSCSTVRLIIKMPQNPSGMTYVGSLTLPFRDFSFVIKVQCQEAGITGIREASLLDRLLGSGMDPDAAMANLNADDEKYDPEFPGHPLSRLRRILNDIEASLSVGPSVKSAPGFALFPGRS